MEEYLQMIIRYYQKNLDDCFPQEKLGVADRLLFNRAIIDVAYQFSSFNEGKPIIGESLQSVLDIMEGYGFNVNSRNREQK